MEPKATILQKPCEVVASAFSVHFSTPQGLTQVPLTLQHGSARTTSISLPGSDLSRV
jgi:hypothetical protein